MSAPGATPGPWATPFEDEMDGVPFLGIDTDQPTGPLCRSICEVSATYVDATDEFVIDDEVRANANLIAASPALYDALEAMIPSNVSLGNDAWPDSTVVPIDFTLGELRAARAALALARGEA